MHGAALAIYSLLGALAVPLLVLRGLWNTAWRGSLAARLGGGTWREVRSLPPRNWVWLHAASMGELVGADPVVRRLHDAAPNLPIVFTTTSTTAQQDILRRKLPVIATYLPFDHPWIVARALGGTSPALCLIAETELWPGLLATMRRRGVSVVLFNGRISDRAFGRYRKLRRFFLPLLGSLGHVFAQTESDAARFGRLGAPAVTVVGSTKYDDAPGATAPTAQVRLEFGLRPEAPCFVAGSVRPGEDELVLRAYSAARRELPQLQLVFAPRHPERWDAAAALLREAGLDFIRRSERAAAPAQALLLDTLGELRRCYGAGDLCFVGGTLVPIGGHNPFEPLLSGKPVIVGPHTANVRDAVEQLRDAGAVTIVRDEQELTAAIVTLLSDGALLRRQADAGTAVLGRHQGATQRVMDGLRAYLAVGEPSRSEAAG